jgi:hypothetical protein
MTILLLIATGLNLGTIVWHFIIRRQITALATACDRSIVALKRIFSDPACANLLYSYRTNASPPEAGHRVRRNRSGPRSRTRPCAASSTYHYKDQVTLGV